jgi:hypothetical protein
MTIPPTKFKLSSRDVARRRDLPQLETHAEAVARNLARIDALFDRAPEIAATLEACERGARCGMIICAVCARSFRFPLIREVLRIASSQPGNHEWVTIYLETLPEGSLLEASLKRVRDRLRQSLQRSGFAGSILIGLIEVS